jgi:hypothetical protein
MPLSLPLKLVVMAQRLDRNHDTGGFALRKDSQ